jgi:hypothetical protein
MLSNFAGPNTLFYVLACIAGFTELAASRHAESVSSEKPVQESGSTRPMAIGKVMKSSASVIRIKHYLKMLLAKT